MKKTRGGIRAIAFAVMMVVCLIPRTAFAVSPKSLKTFTGTTTIYEKVPYAVTRGRVKSLKSSNAQVVKARVVQGYYDERTRTTRNVVLLTPVKPGKATVSFAIGSKRYKMKVVVKKRAIAATQIKVASFGWKKNGKMGSWNGVAIKPNKVLSGQVIGIWYWEKGDSRKVQVTPASGWKILRIDLVGIYNRRIKNGGNILVPKGRDYFCEETIYITMQNKANNGVETIVLAGGS